MPIEIDRRAERRAQYQALRETYDALSSAQRGLVQDEFAHQRARNPTLSWSRFLAVALPLLPDDTAPDEATAPSEASTGAQNAGKK